MTPSRAVTAVGNETLKGLRHGWAERLQILIEMPLFVVFVLLMGFTIGEGESIVADELDWSLETARMSWLMIGFVTFSYTYLHVQKVFWRLLAEIQTGTLEQTYLSPLPSWVHVVAGRVASAIAETAIVVGVVYGVTSLFVHIDLRWRLAALAPLALLIIGAAGLALIIAGIALVWKRVMILNDLTLMLLMFFSGALFPLAELPGWAQAIGGPIFMTHAVEALRITMLEGASLPWSGVGGWFWTLVTAFGWFAAGLLVFRLCERIAQRDGSLSHF
jgi:ABC-type polysaccharide/polyol phosphate export permease